MSESKRNSGGRSRPCADVEEKFCCGKNIEQARLRKGLSRPELASLMGMTLGGVSSWEYGRTRPDLASIKRLCEILKVTSDEILGISDMREELSEKERKLLSDYRALPETEKSYVEGLIGMMGAQSKKSIPFTPMHVKPRPKLISLPVNPLSMCAGDGFDLSEGGETEYIQLVQCGALSDCDELVRVSGRSMEPMFYDGDLALVKHTEDLSEGDIGVFVLDGEGMLKQYRKDGLYPLNKAYHVIRPAEYASFRCFGKVVGKVTQEMMPN